MPEVLEKKSDSSNEETVRKMAEDLHKQCRNFEFGIDVLKGKEAMAKRLN